jgi:hypothetical protein
MSYAPEFVHPARNERDAREMLNGSKTQHGFIGGRLLPPSGQVDKNFWRVQLFFESEGLTAGDAVFIGGHLSIHPDTFASFGRTLERSREEKGQ